MEKTFNPDVGFLYHYDNGYAGRLQNPLRSRPNSETPETLRALCELLRERRSNFVTEPGICQSLVTIGIQRPDGLLLRQLRDPFGRANTPVVE